MKKEQDIKEGKVSEDVIVDVDDVTFEAETDADMVGGKSSFGSGSEDNQIKKLKKKLKEAEQKAKENLDGWQRLKADVANNKQGDADRLKRAKEKGAEDVLESLLPALDSFESAMHGDAWEGIDEAWRMGMEFVHNQLVQALEEHGVQSFGAVGDAFNTTMHEAALTPGDAGHAEGEGETITKVLRKGYKNASGVIRPARVFV